MKKLILLMLLINLLMICSAEEWINFDERINKIPTENIINSNNNNVEFEVEIPGIYSDNVNNFNLSAFISPFRRSYDHSKGN